MMFTHFFLMFHSQLSVSYILLKVQGWRVYALVHQREISLGFKVLVALDEDIFLLENKLRKGKSWYNKHILHNIQRNLDIFTS